MIVQKVINNNIIDAWDINGRRTSFLDIMQSPSHIERSVYYVST